jgi:Inositol polyphosphate kinase
LLLSHQIDYNDPTVRERILMTAIKRASKWMELAQQAKPMVGQVGGIASNKKPLLTLAPDYVLKPVITDHRGIREIAFYEAIRTLTQSKHVQHAYSTFLTGRERQTSKHIGETIDTLAMALAIFLQDQFVLDSEVALRDAWRGLKREVDMIRQLAKFSPPYYGVMGLSRPEANMPFGVTEDAHLLLQDVTINFSKPCVMDLKMGVQTYVSADFGLISLRTAVSTPTTFSFPHTPRASRSIYAGTGRDTREARTRIRQVSTADTVWL